MFFTKNKLFCKLVELKNVIRYFEGVSVNGRLKKKYYNLRIFE